MDRDMIKNRYKCVTIHTGWQKKWIANAREVVYVGTGHRTREDMATVANNFEIGDAPSGFKSPMSRHFGFPIYTNTTGEKWTDKTKTECKYCKRLLTYTGNTSNMQQHISRHHSEKQSNVTPPPERKLPRRQTTLTRGFASPLPHNKSARNYQSNWLFYWKRFEAIFRRWKWGLSAVDEHAGAKIPRPITTALQPGGRAKTLPGGKSSCGWGSPEGWYCVYHNRRVDI